MRVLQAEARAHAVITGLHTALETVTAAMGGTEAEFKAALDDHAWYSEVSDAAAKDEAQPAVAEWRAAAEAQGGAPQWRLRPRRLHAADGEGETARPKEVEALRHGREEQGGLLGA